MQEKKNEKAGLLVVAVVVFFVSMYMFNLKADRDASAQEASNNTADMQAAITQSAVSTTTAEKPVKIPLGNLVPCVRSLGGDVRVPDTHLRENLYLVFSDKPETRQLELELQDDESVLGVYVVKYDGTVIGWQDRVSRSGTYITIWRSDFERARDKLRSSGKCRW